MHIKNKKENTMKPFELGDIFLGCTELIEDIDDHKGNGRILQYDKDFNLKGILWTEGTDHLVIGLKIDPKGILWAFDMHNHIVIRVSPDGKQLPNHHFANRAFSNVTFDKDGNIYLGEALVGNFGSHTRSDYTAIGHAVNLAARLESACKSGKVLIGPESVVHLPPKWRRDPYKPLFLKGIDEPVAAFWVYPPTED